MPKGFVFYCDVTQLISGHLKTLESTPKALTALGVDELPAICAKTPNATSIILLPILIKLTSATTVTPSLLKFTHTHTQLDSSLTQHDADETSLDCHHSQEL